MTKFNNQYHHTRNYGCRFKEIIENGYRALVMENEKIRVSIYLDKGSDIYEFLYKPTDTDFMWRSPIKIDANVKAPVTKEHSKGSFLDIYEGGWQDMLPSIGAPTNYKNMDLGTHGELFTLPFEYDVLEDDPEKVSLKLYTRMKRSPLFVEKQISLEGNNSFIKIDQTITNEADEEFKFSWGQHPAIGMPFLDGNCVIDVPPAKKAKTYQASLSPNQIISPDMEFRWPNIEADNGNTIDLSKIMPPESKTAFITYLEEISEGWYGITNLKSGLGFGMVWDRSVFKHLWMWCVYRGAYGFPWYGRTYNIALEPWSSLPDNFDEVLKNNDYLSLGTGKSLSTSYSAVVYKSEKRIKGFNKDFSPQKD